ncbi:MAG TPA: Maf family protein [Candidatus Saccharimonadales bacterium]|nr:Maf family protein [Candidatus Saccharimonadales bacterium]
MKRIILASQSPRRKELLTAMDVPFDVVPSRFDEQLDDSRTPEDVAKELGLGKALAVAEQYPDAIVVGSDTIVSLGGKQLEKPVDAEEARATLHMLSGRMNVVTTSVAVVCKNQGVELVGAVSTKVFFKPADANAIDYYVDTGDPLDKAGSYGIQSGAHVLVDHIEGDYDAVIGLPTKLLAEYLTILDVQAKPVELTAPVPAR